MAVAVAPHEDGVTALPMAARKEAKPFVKWVGGKRQLIQQLVRYAPNREAIGTYFEPFLGGGALFFHLQPSTAILSDSNRRLIRAYRGIRDDVEGVIDRLKTFRHLHDKHFFLKMRKFDVDDQSNDAGVAAWLIYLNRTAYNGLYRVNSRDLFNVPFGDYSNPRICDEENLRACSEVLKTKEIAVKDFAEATKEAKEGDFVYFDPPYAALTATSRFTDYTSDGFSDEQQIRLRDVAADLKRRRVRVLISNSSAKRVSIWYQDFRRVPVGARRSVNCKPDSRGRVRELLIY